MIRRSTMPAAILCVALVATVTQVQSVQPQDVYNLPLHPEGSMPMVGIGTWQLIEDLEPALDAALQAGYRHIDTATVYRNEHLIGKVLSRWIRDGKVKRGDVFITTKLPSYGMTPEGVPYYLNQSLSQLQTDYVDLYLIHGPRSDADHVAIWKAMEAEHKAGRAKALGVSNFNVAQMEALMRVAKVPVTNNQVELHVFHQQKPLVEFCKKNNVTVTAYSPLGSPGSTWMRRRLPDLLGLKSVKAIAAHHKKTPAQVLLRYILQRGIIVIPKSSKPQRLQENINIFDFALSASEMSELAAQDKGQQGTIFSF